MPKQQPKNAFFYFMIDYKKKQENSGFKYPGGLTQVQKECSKIWERMSPLEKAEFQGQANRNRNSDNVNIKKEKYTSQGVALTHLQRAQQFEAEKQQKIKMTTEQIINDAVSENNLKSQVFCFIYFNYFCKARDGTFVPAELAIVKYSLEEGIIDDYHTLINPGTLPLGMAFSAKQYSQTNHNLPIPPSAKGEINFASIFKDVNDFTFDWDKNVARPIFTIADHIPIAQSILNSFAIEAECEDVPELIPLRDFFFMLKNTTVQLAGQGEPFPSVHIAQAHIERDPYEYYAGFCCETHDELDIPQFCAMSYVKRWCFMISDHCCMDLDIIPVPGKHLPNNVILPTAVKDEKAESDEERFNDEMSTASTSKFVLEHGPGFSGYDKKYKEPSEFSRSNSTSSWRDRSQHENETRISEDSHWKRHGSQHGDNDNHQAGGRRRGHNDYKRHGKDRNDRYAEDDDDRNSYSGQSNRSYNSDRNSRRSSGRSFRGHDDRNARSYTSRNNRPHDDHRMDDERSYAPNQVLQPRGERDEDLFGRRNQHEVRDLRDELNESRSIRRRDMENRSDFRNASENRVINQEHFEGRDVQPYDYRNSGPSFLDRDPRPYDEREQRTYDELHTYEESSPRPYVDRNPSPFTNREPSPFTNREPSPYVDRDPRPYIDRDPRLYEEDDRRAYYEDHDRRANYENRGGRSFGDQNREPFDDYDLRRYEKSDHRDLLDDYSRRHDDRDRRSSNDNKHFQRAGRAGGRGRRY